MERLARQDPLTAGVNYDLIDVQSQSRGEHGGRMARRGGNDWDAMILVGAVGLIAMGVAAANERREAELRRARDHRERVRSFAIAALTRTARALHVPVPALYFDDEHTANAAAQPDVIFVNLAWVSAQFDQICANALACEWGLVLGTVAHEFGHALDPNLNANEHPWARELRADRTAGVVLALEGVAPDAFISLLCKWSALPTRTHPPASMRIDAICEGYSSVTVGRVVRTS